MQCYLILYHLCKMNKNEKVDEVGHPLEYFEASDLATVSKVSNNKTDGLAVATSTLQLTENIIKKQKRKMKVSFKPLIPDNVNQHQIGNHKKKKKNENNSVGHIKVSIGSEQDPKVVKIEKGTSGKEPLDLPKSK